MNGERPTINGERLANGTQQNVQEIPSSAGSIKQTPTPHNLPPSLPPPSFDQTSGGANGDVGAIQGPNGGVDHTVNSGRDDAPTEILQLISQDSYLPMAALIRRASQSCWNNLSDLVDQLASIPVPDLPTEQVRSTINGLPNNQSKANLDKKDRILKFANDQKADFVKLLVLLQWSKNVEEVSKTISLNYWLMLRRQAYWSAIGSLALLKQESSGFQIPNPDLKTAAEVLSTGRVAHLPRLGYVPRKDLSNKQMRRVLRSLNQTLTIKLALSENVPSQMRTFRVHDGRATFSVPNEFELDVSVLNESLDSPFRAVDFRFSFRPAPRLQDRLQAEIEHLVNTNIDRDGLKGCYEFLHELALSYKLAEFHRQALDLARNQWSRNLRVELIRRNLIVQYWSERQIGRSWIEISIASGKRKRTKTDTHTTPFLEVRCFRQGKRVDLPQLHLNESNLSFENILRQVIAQHSTQILDNIYDKLVLTPLFADAELSMEQSLSYTDPEECSLILQTSCSSQLQLKVGAITGFVMISPVTERTERLQFEVNRIQAVADEVVSKLLNFRCSIVESKVLANISGTKWQALRSFKFSQAEIKSLFGRPVARMNMFRQRRWAIAYSLAITHGSDGDCWFLLQQVPGGSPNSLVRYKILRSQKIDIKEELSYTYFDRLADYCTGLICLERNADYFRERKEQFELRPFPAFEERYELPELRFDLDMANPPLSKQPLLPNASDELSPTPASSTTPPKTTSQRRCIRLHFGGMDPLGGKIVVVAQYQNQASSAVLRHMDESVLDTGVTLNPADRVVTIRETIAPADAAIPGIVAKIIDLEKVISTVQQIHALPGVKLQTVSNARISIVYHEGPPTELGLNITFPRGEAAPRLDFFPAEANPHQMLSEGYTKMFTASSMPFTVIMRDLLTSLTMSLPLSTYLHQLQQTHGLDTDTTKQTSEASNLESEDFVRVHVVPRSVAGFGLQYFTPAGSASKDGKNDSHYQMLARFEILPHINAAEKPMWLVRPALEEFNSYSRPSYSAPELGWKLKADIFAPRADDQFKWLALDKGAACMADQPEPLLKAMHETLVSWAKQAKVSVGKGGTNQDASKAKGVTGNNKGNPPNPPNNANSRANPSAKGPPGRPQVPNTTLPNGSNGPNRTMQRPAPNAGGARPMAGNAKPNAKNGPREVIQLD